MSDDENRHAMSGDKNSHTISVPTVWPSSRLMDLWLKNLRDRFITFAILKACQNVEQCCVCQGELVNSDVDKRLLGSTVTMFVDCGHVIHSVCYAHFKNKYGHRGEYLVCPLDNSPFRPIGGEGAPYYRNGARIIEEGDKEPSMEDYDDSSVSKVDVPLIPVVPPPAVGALTAEARSLQLLHDLRHGNVVAENAADVPLLAELEQIALNVTAGSEGLWVSATTPDSDPSTEESSGDSYEVCSICYLQFQISH